MNNVCADFDRAVRAEDGYALAATISPIPPTSDSARLYALLRDTNAFSVQADFRRALGRTPAAINLDKRELNAWIDVYVAYWKAVGEVLTAEESLNLGRNPGRSPSLGATWDKVYAAWKDVLNALYKGYQSGMFDAWTIPCLYVTGKYLRVFAIKADESAASQRDGATFNAGYEDDIVDEEAGHEKLEDAARQINRIFGLCISDRAPMAESRKWGLYYITNLLFKTYFRLNSISLSKNILRSLSASAGDMAPFAAFPKSHQVTFNYYVGVIHFLDENYQKAEEHLSAAYSQSLTTSTRNIQLVLTYLIPTKLITSHLLPSAAMLTPYPRLQRLFGPLSLCIKKGDLAGFDAALSAGEDEFVKRRIYLTLERGRDVCLRNLFRKVYMAGGLEAPKEGQDNADRVRRSRVPIAEFGAALSIGGEKDVETEGVECLIANLIYKNHMKGYISRAHAMVVLNKKGAFPGTGV
ncbi:hypothetical protein MBLNU459_g5686t1 [Dothideomycetes sp. NU459]